MIFETNLKLDKIRFLSVFVWYVGVYFDWLIRSKFDLQVNTMYQSQTP
jgi:hypothetical protein